MDLDRKRWRGSERVLRARRGTRRVAFTPNRVYQQRCRVNIALADRCPWFHSKQYHSPMVCWSWVETRAYRPTRSSVWVPREGWPKPYWILISKSRVLGSYWRGESGRPESIAPGQVGDVPFPAVSTRNPRSCRPPAGSWRSSKASTLQDTSPSGQGPRERPPTPGRNTLVADERGGRDTSPQPRLQFPILPRNPQQFSGTSIRVKESCALST